MCFDGLERRYSIAIMALNRYSRLVETIFERNYSDGKDTVNFVREDLITISKELEIPLPKNLGDIIYTFRYRAALPESITSKAPEGKEWVIRPAGSGRYQFALTEFSRIIPNALLSEIKILDATPGIIKKYAIGDEQGLLARVRYNRLIDVFTGIVCYPLQSHLRTTVPEMGQVETDEIYVGVDRRGVHYVVPVQAKGGSDKLGIVQIEQDFGMCADKFRELTCVPIAARLIEENLIALFSFVEEDGEVRMLDEKHYRLVAPNDISEEELARYRQGPMYSE